MTVDRMEFVSCKHCAMYQPDTSDGATQGLCLRHPPQVIIMLDGKVGTLYPAVKEGGFCGDWRGDAATSKKMMLKSALSGAHIMPGVGSSQ